MFAWWCNCSIDLAKFSIGIFRASELYWKISRYLWKDSIVVVILVRGHTHIFSDSSYRAFGVQKSKEYPYSPLWHTHEWSMNQDVNGLCCDISFLQEKRGYQEKGQYIDENGHQRFIKCPRID